MPKSVRVNDAFFPLAEEIPPAHRLAAPVEQTEDLIDGEIRRWRGEVREVFSPVQVRGASGTKPVRLGSYPLLDEEEAGAALIAAVAAYDQGRGYWPTIGVAERIGHAARERIAGRGVEQLGADRDEPVEEVCVQRLERGVVGL